MVDHLMPLISPLKSLVLRITWDNEKKIQELQQPIMLIAGERDEIVPHRMMVKLHELASKSSYKEIYKIPEGMHNNCFEVAGKEYYKRMERFVRRFDAVSTGIDNPSSFSQTDSGSGGSPLANAGVGTEMAGELLPHQATTIYTPATCVVGNDVRNEDCGTSSLENKKNN